MAPNQLTKLQKYSAPALEKGLDILELLSLAAAEMSLSQIASGVGRSKNEIFRMMIVLEERQFIGRSASDNYYLTDRLSVLGSSRSNHNRLAEVAMPVLLRLAEKTSLTCHMSVVCADDVLVIAQAEAAKGYAISVRVGHRSAILASSAGVCMLRGIEKKNSVNAHFLAVNEIDEGLHKKSASECSKIEVTCMANPEFPGITELSAPIYGAYCDQAIAAITVPYMNEILPDIRKIALRNQILEAAHSMQQRIVIFLPQLKTKGAAP